jgi:hypothetical protein
LAKEALTNITYMSIIKRGIIFFIVALFILSCVTKKTIVKPNTIVLPLGDTISLTDGSLIYGLPMTVFDVTVEMERTIEKPGPYAKFAGEMLGIKDVITRENETWSIISVGVKASEELDPSEFFVIESNTLVQTNALSLKKAGLILDINPALYEKEDKRSPENFTETGQSVFADMGADEYFVTHSDTSYRLVRLDTSFIKIPYLVEKKKQLSVDELAEKAAKTLLELREGKHLILTGEANVFPQNDAAIEEMNRLDMEYTALFAGKTWKEKKSVSYTYIPQKEISGKAVALFGFSDKEGPVEANSKTGVPVMIEIIPEKKIKDLTYITRPVTGEEPVQKFDKLYYRIPDVAAVRLKMGKENLYNSRKLIYQFGEVIQLPANFIIGK